jgi:hypothetical protein
VKRLFERIKSAFQQDFADPATRIAVFVVSWFILHLLRMPAIAEFIAFMYIILRLETRQ